MKRHMGSGRTLAVGVLAAALVAGCSSSPGTGSSGTSSGEIQIAESAAVTGAAGAYGKAKVDGQQAMIAEINATGGVNGQQIVLNVLDDALDPAKAVQNTRKLLADGNIAFLQGTGSGSLNSMEPLLQEKGVPMLFPAKTDPGWVDSLHPMIFPQIAAYRDQSAAMITYAFQKYGPGKVFFVATQSPDLAAILATAKQTVTDEGGTWLGSNEVPFGAADVGPFALQAAAGAPDYVLFATAPAETTKIVAAMARNNTLPAKKILGLTSMPGTTYATGVPAGAAEKTVSLSSIVPPSDPAAKVCVDAVKKHNGGAAPDLVSVWGCSEVLMLQSTLELAKQPYTSQSIITALQSVNNKALSPLAPPLTYTATSHTGPNSLPVVVLRNGVFESDGSAPIVVNPGA